MGLEENRTDVGERINELECQHQDFMARRQTRIRGNSAYKRLTRRIANIDKKLHYYKGLDKRHKEAEQRAKVEAICSPFRTGGE